MEAITGTRFTITPQPKVSNSLWDEIIEAHPRGALPHIENCYYLEFETLFGEKFVIPDFVYAINVPVGWSSRKPKDLHPFTKMKLAPERGSFIKQWAQSRFLQKIEGCLGFVAWIPHPDYDKPWEQPWLMPDFKAGITADEAVRQFL